MQDTDFSVGYAAFDRDMTYQVLVSCTELSRAEPTVCARYLLKLARACCVALLCCPASGEQDDRPRWVPVVIVIVEQREMMQGNNMNEVVLMCGIDDGRTDKVSRVNTVNILQAIN
jgi:hypothetical protein